MDHTELLKDFFTNQQPLGPISADDYEDLSNREVFLALFDRDNEPYRSLGKNPTMIIGRKGSGKTDVLLSYKHETSRFSNAGYDPVVYFTANESSRFITAVVTQVADAVAKSFPPPMVEDVAEFWNGLFWIAILARISVDNQSTLSAEADIIRRYISQYGIDDERETNPYRVILRAISVLKKLYDFSEQRELGFDFFSSLPELTVGEVTLEDAKFAALNWLRSERRHAIILFDSVEALDLVDPTKLLVISALLKAIGSFERAGIPISFRCCIPAESFYQLSEISSNTLKDFQRTTRLQWSAIELLRLAARRYEKYIDLYLGGEKGRGAPFDLSKRTDVVRFWEAHLPSYVPNLRTGQDEPTITYILRHTQLLPRQILLIMNEIFAAAIREGDSDGTGPLITADMVVEIVRECEPRIISQILKSYDNVWPGIGQVLESVLPGVGENIISYSDFHSHFNKRGIEGRSGVDDFPSFLRMLSQLGAVGRLVKAPGTYVTALYEYSEPNKMIYMPGDVLCFHPLFTGRFRMVSPEPVPETYRPVYPLGTEIDTDDRRVEQYW